MGLNPSHYIWYNGFNTHTPRINNLTFQLSNSIIEVMKIFVVEKTNMTERKNKLRHAIAASVISAVIAASSVLANTALAQPATIAIGANPNLHQTSTAHANPSRLKALEGDKLKDTFTGMMVPVIEHVQHEIKADRERISRLMVQKVPSPTDKKWLHAKMGEYGVKNGNIKELYKRVDIVPTSMTLAQAAHESGWGKSKLAQHSNALFGQKKNGRRYQRFASFEESVRSYMKNLNSNDAYARMRDIRYRQRTNGQELDSMVLLASISSKYAANGSTYTAKMREVIRNNDLKTFDKRQKH